MTDLIGALKQLKIQTGSLACLGCYHEHSCSTRGCAIIRAAIEELERYEQAANITRITERCKPVVRAYWVRPVPGDGEPYCSHCMNSPPCYIMSDEYEFSDYCPNCGANMTESRGAE